MLSITGIRKNYLGLLILRAPFDALFTFTQATFLKKAFQAVSSREEAELFKVCAIFGIACCFLFLYNGTVWRAFATMNIKLGGKLRRIMLQRISELSLSTMEEKSQGDLLTRINQDAGMALQMLGGPLNIPHLVVAFINITVSSVMLLSCDIQILLLVWLFILPHVFLSQAVIAKPMTRYQTGVQKAAGASTTVLSAMINSADTAILYDAQGFLMQEYDKCSKIIFLEKMKMVKRNTLGSALIPLFGLGGYLTLLMIGGNSIAKGNMSFGDLAAIFQFRGGVLLGAMMMINSMVNLKVNLTGAMRVKEIIGGQKDAE